MLTVKILGSGRTNFISVESIAQKAITDLAVETEMVEEGDLKNIMAYTRTKPTWRLKWTKTYSRNG